MSCEGIIYWNKELQTTNQQNGSTLLPARRKRDAVELINIISKEYHLKTNKKLYEKNFN
jgi:hypothetical protein